MLTEEGSGKDVVEELQKHNLHLPSTDQVYTLPTPTTQSTPKSPTAKAKAKPSLHVQNLKKLVTSAQFFDTTSKTLAATHTACHSGWFGCWFRFGAPRS